MAGIVKKTNHFSKNLVIDLIAVKEDPLPIHIPMNARFYLDYKGMGLREDPARIRFDRAKRDDYLSR
ncbi:MAG: hypothetical protein JRH07_13300 [Deltaproteobacteria bacterium]|nr:hypothetical protein [Deltaproteobacteria bacterium]MBW2122801.1 hypothetical protein [Deltaproteobacteria bacterium]